MSWRGVDGVVRPIGKSRRHEHRLCAPLTCPRLTWYGCARGAAGLLAASFLAWHWQAPANAETVTRVLLIGGSAARGWQDPHHNSYLKRAFATVELRTGRSFQLFDQTIPGGTAASLPLAHYQQWLNTDHPNVVVLSWGLLNDVHQRTPMAVYNAAMRDEIRFARSAQAEVLLVTPPVTKASATNGWPLERVYMQNEVRDARAFAVIDAHVHVIDLFSQMKSTLQARGETFEPYAADWAHPNGAGHQLAGELLAADLLQPTVFLSITS